MIDDLIRFCLAEIAYEGELGCSIERLKELISEFSAKITIPSTATNPDPQNENGSDNKQNVDDAYCSYVYSLIARHPSIVVGTVPEECPPVWIAPPPRKTDVVAPPPISLHVVEDGKHRSMMELVAQYGDVLRIAADKDTCFLMLTGSHNRPTKLTDTVYTTLQIVTRAREKGVAIKDLGPMTGYDPKAIFYQISQLIDLNLVAKVSKGPSLNWAVHKKFYDNSHFWHMMNVEPEAANTTQEVAEDGEDDDELEADLIGNIPLLRVRVLRLLEKSKNLTHQNHDLISAVGYRNPTKSQRRFFSSRINEMVEEGLIDRITVPSTRGNTICLQLIDAGKALLEKIDRNSQQKNPDNEGELSYADVEDTEYPWTDTNLLLHGRGLQCQIIDLLKDSPKGLIIKDIHQALGFIDRRSIEQLLARLCSRIPPRHLAHLHPVTIMETVGKMRRQRYFTLQYYQTMLQEQNITDERIDWIHLNEIGEFSYASPDMFWTSKTELYDFVKRFQRSSGRQLQRSLKNPKVAPKSRKHKNPIVNGVVAKGRPRKEWTQTSDAAASGSKRKRTKSASKRKKEAVDEEIDFDFDDETVDDYVENETPNVATTSEIRPRKKKKAAENTTEAQQSTGRSATRGRKRIAAAMEDDEDHISAQPSKKRRLEVEQQEEESMRMGGLIRSTSTIAHPPTSPVPPEDQADTAHATTEREPLATDVTMPGTTTPKPKSPKKKRNWRSQPKPKATNISDVRRQQDLLELIKSNDGIMQLNHEMSLLLRDKQADKSGPAGSEASFVSDKKTIQKAVDGLQDKGELKIFKTMLSDPHRVASIPQMVTIVHLADLPQASISKFVTDLQSVQKQVSSPSQPRQVPEGLEFTRRPRQPGERKEHAGFDPIEYTQILGPRQRFLEDFQTVSQLFGFLLGKSRRCQELYLFTLSCILSGNPQPGIISASERIVATPYWTEDYPVGSFCAVIPVYSYVPYLETIQQDKDALNQPLRSLDRQLYRVMKVGSTQTRTRLMVLLQTLAALQLITPLEEDPWGSIIVGEGEARRSFSPVKSMPTVSGELPPYWKFNRMAPLWLFGARANAKDSLKFFKNMPIHNMEDAMTYWDLLQKLCNRSVDFSVYESSSELPVGGAAKVPEPVIASLCTSKSWTSNYRLSKMQEEYLKKMIDIRTLTTPLNDPTSERLTQATHVTCAPPDAVTNFFASQLKKLSSAQKEIQERKKKADATELAEKELERKAQQHLAVLGEQWDQLVTEIKKEGLTEEETDRLVPLKSRYITVGGQVERTKLKELIEAVLKDPVKDAKRRYKTLDTYQREIARTVDIDQIEQAMPTLPPPQPRRFRGVPAPQTLIWNHSTAATFVPAAGSTSNSQSTGSKSANNTGEIAEPTTPKEYPPLPPRAQYGPRRSVVEIIESMGPGPDGKREKQVIIAQSGREIVSRQKKFVWSVEYDELLCDAVAVIKARCRGKSKVITWAPIEALFPPLSHGRTRNRHKKWLAKAGSRKYMDRLILTWYNLWQQHKGRLELPDEDPSNPEGCDLITHIEFLRTYVDKKNLNQSVVISTDDTSGSVAQSYIDLPSTLSEIFRYYQVEMEGDFVGNTIDQYWGDITAGDAEKVSALQSTAFSEPLARILGPEKLKAPLAESVIQMIVSTDQEDYDEEAATAALRPFGDEVIKKATFNLSQRGTLNKLSKHGNGRIYRMSDQNAEDLTGKLSLQRCQDAAALEKVFEEQPDELRLWSLMPNEGEMAGLLHRVTDHQAEFQIQLPDLKQARDHAQWTSRKIQDDMIEAQVAVLFHQVDSDTPRLGSNLEPPEQDEHLNHGPKLNNDKDDESGTDQNEGDHGVTITSDRASCLVNQPEAQYVSCQTCLRKALTVLEDVISTQLTSGDDDTTQLVLNIRQFLGQLQNAGDHGLTAEEVWAVPGVSKLLDRLSSSPVPLVFWTGYTRCRLVSSHYLNRYGVWIQPSEQGDKECVDQNKKDKKLAMPSLVIPYRWIDLQGKIVKETLRAAQRAVVGLLMLKPRMQHNQLIEGLNKAYSRLDILYVLRHLETAGMLQRVVDDNGTSTDAPIRSIEQVPVEEESRTFWEIGEDFDWQAMA